MNQQSKSASEVVSHKFYGKFADALSTNSAPRYRDIEASLASGAQNVEWQGQSVTAVFYLDDGLPKAIVRTDKKYLGVIASIDLAGVAESVFWVDCMISKL